MAEHTGAGADVGDDPLRCEATPFAKQRKDDPRVVAFSIGGVDGLSSGESFGVSAHVFSYRRVEMACR